jgi:hypothetical protein
MIKWTVSWPAKVAEDNALSRTVEAETIEEAIIAAEAKQHGVKPGPGDRYTVTARVEVVRHSSLPLRSY